MFFLLPKTRRDATFPAKFRLTERMTPGNPAEDVTMLLHQMRSGRQDALEKLLPLVYAELRRLAGRYLRDERANHTLQPTALVHEAFLRLAGQDRANWRNRAQFMGVAGQLMRRILVDYARSRRYSKRGGEWRQVPLNEAIAVFQDRQTDIVALDDALRTLSDIDPRKGRVVEMRFFGGLSIKEAAEVLNVSQETVLRDWRLAKVWLLRELSQGTANEG